ncbi:MAG TPA: DUF4328 domain-containing protein [Pseudonocardiaceae bacterium]|nr:DUF4328 domain-containing protein [Pseudonocardiaceae bacterium]
MNQYQDGRFFRPVRGVGVATIVFIWLALAATLAVPFAVIHAIDVINSSFTDEAVDNPAVAAAAGEIAVTVLAVAAVYLTAAILYWVWSWRARGNAEGLAGRQSQDLSKGWTFWGWICPFVNLWFPCQILLDIHRASDRRQQRGTGMVIAWWVCFLGAQVLPGLILGASQRRAAQQVLPGGITITTTPAQPADLNQVDLGQFTGSGVLALLLGGLLLVTAAVLITRVIRRISDWQSTPREQW